MREAQRYSIEPKQTYHLTGTDEVVVVGPVSMLIFELLKCGDVKTCS